VYLPTARWRHARHKPFLPTAPRVSCCTLATLNTYFLLKIRYNIPGAVIEKRYEVWFHLIPIGVWLTAGIVGLSLKVFGPILLPELGCWIGSYPYGCYKDNSCTRGFRVYQNNDWYAWTFAYMWLFICVIVVFVNSILIYTAIRKQERRNEQYLAAKLQKKSPSSATSFPFSRSSSQQVTVPGLPLPDFDCDFVDQNNCENQGTLVLVADGLLSSHFTCSPDKATSSSVPDDPSALKIQDNDALPQKEATSRTPGHETTTAGDATAGASPPLSNRNSMARTNQRRIKQSRMAAVQSSCYIFPHS
jgi:hypothetical protein